MCHNLTGRELKYSMCYTDVLYQIQRDTSNQLSYSPVYMGKAETAITPLELIQVILQIKYCANEAYLIHACTRRCSLVLKIPAKFLYPIIITTTWVFLWMFEKCLNGYWRPQQAKFKAEAILQFAQTAKLLDQCHMRNIQKIYIFY